jgi:hypothetical protein
MSENSKTIKVYTMPQETPCGPASSCCGPIGQTEQEITQMRREIEERVPGIQVEVINIRQEKLRVQRDVAVLKVLQMFGPMALPVLAVNGEVVSIGPTEPDRLGPLLRAKFPSAR